MGVIKTLAELRAAVEAALERWDTALGEFESADDENRDERKAAVEAAETAHTDAVTAYDRRKALEEAKADLPVAPVDEPEVRVRVKSESTLTYEKPRDRSAPSIFRDMAMAQFEMDSQAAERIHRHGREMADASNPQVGERALNITDGTGGEFVPPMYLQDQWIGLPRARRPIADSLGAMDLPPDTDTINIPKVSTGTAVAVQTDGNAVQSTDLADTHVTAAVQTVAGQQDVSQQLVDLSAPGIDVVIWDDITRAYDTKIDTLVINGTVTNAKGLAQVASTNSRVYTDASPTVPELWPKLAGAIADVHTGIYESPTVIAMHPLRWAWILASLDSNNRPLVVPTGQPGFNAVALQEKVAAENLVGSIMGIPTIVDASLPTTNGAGTNEDIVLVYDADEVLLWESPSPRLRVFGEVLSNTLQVRFQLYNYYAIMAGRLPKAITVVSGTGLAAPTF